MFDIIVFILMTAFMLICLYPLYFILIASISDPNNVLNGKVILFPSGVTFDGYARIFREQKIWTGYRNTIIYTTIGTFINVVITIMGGYALSRKDMPGRRPLLLVIAFTMFFNGGMIPTYMVVRGLRLTDTLWAMVLPNAVQVWNLMIARTFFETTIPGELLDAAMIDGCRTLRFFAQIVIPLSKPIIAVMVLFYAISHWNAFFYAFLYLSSPDRHPLQIILRNILLTNQPDASMVDDIATVLERQKLAELIKYGVITVGSIPVLVMYPFVQRFFVSGVMIGSIKG
jgi:putative aldouronate transport system permease protein